MMLGGNCSPCCGPPACTTQAIADFYNLLLSADVNISLSGASVERDGATVIWGNYYLRFPFDSPLTTSEYAFVYKETASPIGTYPLAISPTETTIEQFGPLSLHFATVVFRYEADGFNVLLELIMRPSFVGPFAFRPSMAWPGTSCRVAVRLEVSQVHKTFLYSTESLMDPSTALTNQNNMGGCNYNLWLTDYVSELFEDADYPVPYLLAGFDYAKTGNPADRQEWNDVRYYWRDVDDGMPLVQFVGDNLLLSGERSIRQHMNLPRFVDDTSSSQWYNNVTVTKVPEFGVSCGWSITGTPSGKSFAVAGLAGWAFASDQHRFTTAQHSAQSDITPLVSFSWP